MHAFISKLAEQETSNSIFKYVSHYWQSSNQTSAEEGEDRS